jgi:hypothetical protein
MTELSLAGSIETNAYLVRQLEAKDKQIRHLNFILEQRYRETKRQFDPSKLEEMKGKVYQIFLASPGVGFTYEEAEEEFERMYGFKSANVGQRMRDLRQEKPPKLWSSDEEGKVRFYLRLATEKEGVDLG